MAIVSVNTCELLRRRRMTGPVNEVPWLIDDRSARVPMGGICTAQDWIHYGWHMYCTGAFCCVREVPKEW